MEELKLRREGFVGLIMELEPDFGENDLILEDDYLKTLDIILHEDLNDREYKIISRLYGIFDEAESLRYVAHTEKVTKNRVMLLKQGALGTLRKDKERILIGCFYNNSELHERIFKLLERYRDVLSKFDASSYSTEVLDGIRDELTLIAKMPLESAKFAYSLSDKKIETLKLGRAITRCLKNDSVLTIGVLANLTHDDLRQIPGIDEEAVNMINQAYFELGYKISPV